MRIIKIKNMVYPIQIGGVKGDGYKSGSHGKRTGSF